MAVTGDCPDWDRFARWPAWAARLLLAGFAATLAFLSITAAINHAREVARWEANGRPEGSIWGYRGENTDLALYTRLAERVGAGEDYYAVAVEEQRARGYPLRPGFTVRLPTLVFAAAWLGESGLKALAALLVLAVLLAWWRRLGGEPGGQDTATRLAALVLIGVTVATGYKVFYYLNHDFWAGLLLAFALALHRPGRWGAALPVAALALAIRENALPFVLLLGAMAAWRRDWCEAAAWSALVAVFLAALALHQAEVARIVLPTDPETPGWLTLRGIGGWVAYIILSTAMFNLPPWLSAPLALVPLLGWAAWRSPLGLTGFLLYLGYGVAFMIAGRSNNFYWGLMITPAYFVGLVFVPRALSSLWSAARGH